MVLPTYGDLNQQFARGRMSPGPLRQGLQQKPKVQQNAQINPNRLKQPMGTTAAARNTGIMGASPYSGSIGAALGAQLGPGLSQLAGLGQAQAGGMGQPQTWQSERDRLSAIASGALEDPSVTSMKRQLALAGSQAYGGVPQMQSAAARSRLQGGARGAVELEAGQLLKAQQLQSQQAAQEGLTRQLAEAQATEQRRLEEERRAAIAKEMAETEGRYREQSADQAQAAALVQALPALSEFLPDVPGIGAVKSIADLIKLLTGGS